jgi:hypothetical protein
MYLYQAFGRCLLSEIRLPDLQRLRRGTPDWSLRVGRGSPVSVRELVAEQPVEGDVLRVWRTDTGVRFVYEPVGSFEIAASGRDITWFPAAAPNAECVVAAVVGPVLALALHLQGTVCLHGSALRIGREGVAFIAPKHYGKSTLAAVLLEAGAELISDDTLAVEFQPVPVLLPGVHSLKLWKDSLERIAPALPSCVGAGIKPVLRGFPASARRRRATPLAAAYLLRPVRGDSGVGLSRERLSPREAVLSLVANAKVGALLDPARAGSLLSTAAAIVKTVPVYVLTVPRDWQRLPELVRTITGWHASAHTTSPVLQRVG